MPAGITSESDSRFCWTDSSDNEDGFEIGVEFCDRSFTFTVGPDVTCIDLPPEARLSAFPDDCFGAYYLTVVAFNAAGRSFPQLWWMPVRKGEPPTPTPAPTVVAPKTGAPLSGDDGGSGWALPLLAAGGSLLVLSAGLGAIIRGRHPARD